MQITRFPSNCETVSDRMAGFMAHLRDNGLKTGVSETQAALEALALMPRVDIHESRSVFKAICTSHADEFLRFDELFKAYWQNSGRERSRHQTASAPMHNKQRWSNQSLFEQGAEADGSGNQDLPDDGDGDATSSGEGKLVATQKRNVEKADLREFMKPEDLAEACRVAERLAKAIRDRRSRRRRQSLRGGELDLRRMTRKSLARGGEPIDLLKRKRPDRPVHLVALLDVSGSMTVYARVFLAFLKGLMSADQRTDAYLFHTQLVRISDALRDGDTFRAVNRLSMMAQGFGGGTKIGSNLQLFNRQYAANQVNSRSVIIILSDGYDTDPPEVVGDALKRLKKRGCKLIWLNPLKGWKDYEPVAKGMAASLPHLDHFAAATTLSDLAALEPHLARV